MQRSKVLIPMLLCSLFIFTGHAFAWGIPEQRQDRQQQRIEQGVRNGSITYGELQRLNKEQQRIALVQHRARKDRHITRQEARRIDRLQDRASRNICKYKHNGVEQPRVAAHSHHRPVQLDPAPLPRRCGAAPYPLSSFRGALLQPGLSLAWNIALD